MPSPSKLAYGEKLPVNFEMLVKITTNLKLDIIEDEGTRLVKNVADNETHYVRFESVVDEYEISFKTVFTLLR